MKTLKEFLLEREYNVFDDSAINEMANFTKRTTKLPCNIYIADHRGVKHGPRIKVNADYGVRWIGTSFSITISNTPQVIGKTGKIKISDIETIKDWILLNQKILFQYWDEDIDVVEFIVKPGEKNTRSSVVYMNR